MVLRLDPRFELVWRSPTSLQVGVDPARAVLDDVTRLEERLVAALVTGATRSALEVVAHDLSGGSAGAPLVAHLLARLEPALEPPRRRRAARVAVCGATDGAIAIADALGADGFRVELVREGDDVPAGAEVAVLVGHHVLPPGARGAWLRRDVPHVPVVFTDDAVHVGPVVEAGGGPCLWCVELTRTDDDPAWPALAAQLLGRRAAAEQPLLVREAATAAVRAVRELATGRHPGSEHPSLRLGLDGSLSRRVWRRHAACLCSDAALAGTGSPRAATPAAPVPPTTGAVAAAPA